MSEQEQFEGQEQEQEQQPPRYAMHEKYEKEEEKGYEKEEEKAHEKGEEKSWDEKWRRDPLGAAVWAIILVWAGLVLLAANLEMFAALSWSRSWGVVFSGAAVIVMLGAIFRLVVPSYRRPIGGTLILVAILLGIGLGILLNTYLVWPLVLIAIGVGALLRGLGVRR